MASVEKGSWLAPWVLEMYFEGHKWPALLDSSSSVSMMQSHLLPMNLPVVISTWIACLHNHTRLCPIAEISLYYLGNPRKVQVARVHQLPYLVLLGRYAPVFKEALASFVPMPEAQAFPVEQTVPQPHGTDSGVHVADPSAVPAEEPQKLLSIGQLSAAKEADPTLTIMKRMMALSEEHVIDARWVGRWPQYAGV